MDDISLKAVAQLVARLKALIWGSKRGIWDAFVSMIPQGVRVLTGLVSSVLLARGLGPAGLGQYTLVLSLAESAGQLSDLGIGQTAIRYASRAVAEEDKEQQLAVLRWAFRVRMVLVALVTLLFFVLAPFLANQVWQVEGLTPLIRLGLLSGVFGAISSVPILYFQSLKQFGMNAAVLTGQSLIIFGGILLLQWLDRWTVASIITVLLVGTGIGALIFLFLIPKAAIFPPKRIQDASLKEVINFWRSPVSAQSQEALDESGADTFAFYMILSTVIVLITLRADVWLMGAFLDDSQVGVYSAATRFTLPLTIVLNGVYTALWPRASAKTEVKDTIKLLFTTFKLSVLLAAGGLLYSFFTPLLAPWLFGEEYASSVLLGQLLCLRYVIAILINPIGIIGYNFGLVRVYWLINLLQLGIVLGMNIVLLPMLGPIGSALALLANDVVGGIISALFVWRKIAQMGGESESNKK